VPAFASVKFAGFIQNVPAFQQLCEIKYPIIVSDPESCLANYAA